MARQAVVGSFTILLTVVALGQARAEQFACCRQFCGNGVVDCALYPASACATNCSNLCGGFGSPCVGVDEFTCPGGQSPVNCADGCRPVCPAAPAPTLTPWALLAMALMLATVGVFTLRRRMRR
jgi:hypothetical protein